MMKRKNSKWIKSSNKLNLILPNPTFPPQSLSKHKTVTYTSPILSTLIPEIPTQKMNYIERKC